MSVSVTRRAVRAAAALGFVAALLVPLPASAGQAAPPKAAVAFEFSDERIDTSSGLAVLPAEPDHVFTINDSGPTRVFGVSADDGRSDATMRLRNADKVDWEAIAPGKGRTLWIGDIGDNDAQRDSVTVYRFRLPDDLATGFYEADDSYELTYPDGAHDAEALLVNPKNSHTYIVTKDEKGGALYRADDLGEGQNELRKLGAMPPLITDGAFRSDGEQFVLRSYTTGYVYSTGGKQLAKFELPKQKQGEGIAYAPGGKSLLLSSEGAGSEVLRLRLSDVMKSPSATASPGSSATPSSSELGASGEDSGGFVNGLFIVGPFAIALVAAAAAFFIRRRTAAPVGAHGGGRRDRRYDRDEPYPPPAYGERYEPDGDDRGWPGPPQRGGGAPGGFGPPGAQGGPPAGPPHGRRSAQPSRRAGSRPARGRRRGSSGDDGEPFWLRD
ncbi:MAG: hypothetical protein GEV10_05160 [Streptosporangiales bacterium]|nr:hypothetical protein [Streptosporangiales bacterium]